MTNKNEDTNGKPALLGIPPQELVDLIGFIAAGNLIALLRVTSVCQFLDTHADSLPEGDPSRKAIRKALAGFGLAGQLLCQQGKQLSDHEDRLVESCEKKGVDVTIRQTGEWATKVAEDVNAAAKEWLATCSEFNEKPRPKDEDADTDTDKPEPKPRGGDTFGPNGQRLN